MERSGAYAIRVASSSPRDDNHAAMLQPKCVPISSVYLITLDHADDTGIPAPGPLFYCMKQGWYQGTMDLGPGYLVSHVRSEKQTSPSQPTSLFRYLLGGLQDVGSQVNNT